MVKMRMERDIYWHLVGLAKKSLIGAIANKSLKLPTTY